MESSHFCIDWRKKVVIQATLKPACMNRVDVFFDAIEKRPVFEPIIAQREWVFENDRMKVIINPATGLVDSWEVDGEEYLKKDSFQLIAVDGTYNSWGLWTEETACRRNFNLLTSHEGSEFSGLRDQVAPSVKVIEDGPVRTVVEALFGWHNSKIWQRYILPKRGVSIEVETVVYWNENDMVLKMQIPTVLENGSYLGQVMFGHETLCQEGQEVVAQKWNAITDGRRALAVFNRGSHGSCERDGVIGLTLLHSAGYSAADGNYERTLRELRHTVRMEQGERLFSFRLQAGKVEQLMDHLDQEGQIYNEQPYAFAFSPSGNGEKKGTFITVDNDAVLISAFKRAESGKGYTIRVFEGAGKDSKAVLRLPWAGLETEIHLHPFEVKTLHFDETTGVIVETDLLD